jgi:hypothetical protein
MSTALRPTYLEGWKGAMRGVDAEVIWAENQHRRLRDDETKGYLEAQKYLQTLMCRRLTKLMLTGHDMEEPSDGTTD